VPALRRELRQGGDDQDARERAVEDPALEWKLCVAAIPAALALALAFHVLTPGLQRVFLGMPVHELGHAVSAWFCYGMYRAYLAEKLHLVALGGALLVVQGIGTLVIQERTAEMLFTFGGDGMGMVLAAALMATFFFGKRSQLYKGWLRWGFLMIGAAAFTDMFATWWAAQSDSGAIPFGEIEGVGLSDPMKLVEEHGWSTKVMVRRYVMVGLLCLLGLAVIYAWGVRHAWRKAQAAGPTR